MEVVFTKDAPTAIGAYSQAISVGELTYLSGQIGLIPSTMQMCGDDISKQTQQVLDNIQSVCNAVNCSLADIVKLTVYLKDINDFSVVNNIMEKNLTKPYPARSLVEVSNLPRNAKIEIDAIILNRPYPIK